MSENVFVHVELKCRRISCHSATTANDGIAITIGTYAGGFPITSELLFCSTKCVKIWIGANL